MNLPSLATQKKDREYHLAWGKALAKYSLTNTWAIRYRVKQEAIKYFNQGSTGDMTPWIQKAQDGSDLPAMYFSISALKAKIENLIGELESRGWELRVRALSKEAVSRKHEAKETLRVQRRLQDAAQFAQERTGLPVQDPNIPQSDLSLDEWADLKYKDKLELVYEMGLKDLAKRNNVDRLRNATFKDVWIQNACFIRNEIVRGVPRPFRVEPLCFVWDPNATDDELSDSTYFLEAYYMGLAEAAERYNLTQEELEKAQNNYNVYTNMNAGLYIGASQNHFFDCIDNGSLGWFRNIDNVPRVMVLRAVWKDFKTRKYKNEVKEKYGTEHLQELTDENKTPRKANIITSKMECWRGITMIGGEIIREWGELPNQPRDIDTLEKTLPPYTCWVPNYMLGQSISKVEQVVALDLLKDMAMYNLQLAMNRAGAKGFVFDMALMPEGWNLDKVASYLKTAGIVAVNTKEYQMMQGGMNVLKEIDLSITQGIREYVEIMNFLDQQENIILGSSAERQGVVQAPSQAVGVTDAAIFQSAMTTKPYFIGFERFWSRVMTQQAKLMRIAMADREVFEPIIGSAGVDFLKENIDIDLESVGVIVESLPPLLQDRAKFENFIMLAVQSQQLEVQDALDILLDPDIKQALRKLQRKVTVRKMLESQMQQAEQERDAQLQQKLSQDQMATQQMNIQGQMGLQQLKNKGNLDKTALTGKVKLNDSKIKTLATLAAP